MKFHHLGIVVENISDSLKEFKNIFETEETSIPFHDTIQRVNVLFLNIGDIHIELIEPAESETPVTSFLKNHGSGIHHLGFEVDDIENEVKKLKINGGKVVCNPVIGFENRLVSFIYVDSLPCKLIELVTELNR